ncbi:MAG: lysine--tRNA ligase [Planctomycetales bacterium]|nr:lysine--tRNA ligase [Planctomycetales bacterium]
MSEDLIQVRAEKAARLRALGVDPYGGRYDGIEPVAALLPKVPATGPGPEAALAGRIMRMRAHGKTTFLDVADRTGRLQVYARADQLGAAYEVVSLLDLGDIVGAQGVLQKTRTGEPTLFAKAVTILTKALRPPPEKFHGLADPEIRFRQRYVDLTVTEEARRYALARTKVVAGMRRILDAHGFVEVETPVLQPLYGGAAARPFTTHHNTLDMKLYLRIATELYLKRLLVGGLERVYEIGKDFRNEGIDKFHNPEFTMMECYQAYADYTDMMALVEEIVATLAREVTGGTTLERDGKKIDVTPPWPRLPFLQAVRDRTGLDLHAADVPRLREACRTLGIAFEPGMGAGALLDAIWSDRVEPHLIGPVFVTDYPVETTALARRHRKDPALVERFEAFLFGKELGNAFSELNDPADQRARLEEQARLLAAGDAEAHAMDEDFVRALEHGMPPAGGLGMGVDRLTMFLTGAPNIREVILFPLLRPEAGSPPPGAGG